MTARDFELGLRPKCSHCGTDLDIETDCHHDGYAGSPHAHGGRGSYGMGSHHFVFNSYCEACADMPEPLRKILEYNWEWEWLECGHKQATPTDQFGRIRPGERRRCRKCKKHSGKDFDVSEMLREHRKKAFAKRLERQRNCEVEVTRHDTTKNWYSYISSFGFTEENCRVWELTHPRFFGFVRREDRAELLRRAMNSKAEYEKNRNAHEWAYNSDDH